MSDITWTNGTRKLSDLVPWAHNPKRMTKKQAEGLKLSIERFGFAVPFLISPNNDIYDGHQRQTLMNAMREHGGNAEVDVRVSSRLLTDDERRELIVRLKQNQAGWDFDMLPNLYEREELLEWGFEPEELGMFGEDMLGVEKDAKPNPRNLPIDVIFTMNSHGGAFCCIATYSGWLYGINSTIVNVCARTNQGLSHSVRFIDNDYFHYDHSVHFDMVKQYRPKYATVRDVMTEAQCQEAGIEFFELPQILDWAEELAQYAENVIVIPKYDCLHRIPKKFMLGYSVPSSHGGTPLPVDLFKDRRVHLLGGSWKAQLAHMAALGDDVVSLDNNYIMRQAGFASFVYQNGETGQLLEDLGLDNRVNPMYVAFSISVGNVAAKVNELYAGSANLPEQEDNGQSNDFRL